MRSSAFIACSFFAFFIATDSTTAQVASESKKDWKPFVDAKSEEIIDRCMEAMGGEMTLMSAETIELKGETIPVHESDPNFDASKTRKVYLKNDLVRTVTESKGGRTIERVQLKKLTWLVLNGKESSASVMEQNVVPRDAIPWPGIVLTWKNNGKQIRFLEKTTYKDKAVNTLAFERFDGVLTHMHFDATSGLLIAVDFKSLANGGSLDAIQEFEYQTVEGIAFPVVQRTIQTNLHETVFKYDVVEIGGEMPDEYFEMTPALQKRLEEINELRDFQDK